jgi:hypothetical protein
MFFIMISKSWQNQSKGKYTLLWSRGGILFLYLHCGGEGIYSFYPNVSVCLSVSNFHRSFLTKYLSQVLELFAQSLFSHCTW